MKTMKQKTRATAAAALLLGAGTALLSAGCGRGGEQANGNGAGPGGGAPGAQAAAAQATPVRVAPATTTTVRRTIPVTGSVAALQSVDLSPKVTARVVSVAGREGAPVRRGQVVVQQDTADLVTQVQQAEANLQAAQARLAQTQTQARLQVTQSSTAVQDAQEQLRAAEAQLALAKRPQRTQEIAMLQSAVNQAQANYERASVDRKRYQGLVKEGAAAQSVLDQYATQETVTRAALESARQQLEAAQIGGREESVRSAQAAVARARAGLRLAQSNRQQNLVREDEVRAARAAIAQNRAALAFARQQLENASIRSPIDGVISERLTEPGQLAAPGSSVVRLVALDTVFYEAQVPETDIRSVRQGQNVNVKVDALPNRSFVARVARVYPTASTQSRNFTVRVVLPNTGKLLRPGMFARGEVVAESRTGVVVSKDALLSREGKTLVFVAGENNKAEMRTVRAGVETRDTVEVLSGVRPGERVIVVGQDALTNGAAIQVQTGDGAQRAASAR